MLITFIALITLLGLTFAHSDLQKLLISKSREEWILDFSGLFVQGVVISWLQVAVVYQGYHQLFPALQTTLSLHPALCFFLSFVLVDYLYYWNHRLLHSPWLWTVHQVHHTVTTMDVLGTSRNTLWSSFFIVYLWIHALFIYLLQDPTAYVLGVSCSNALDLWRHSSVYLPSWLNQWLSPWLILPQDHAWHHSQDVESVNFGANLKIWDRLHHTDHKSDYPYSQPYRLGMTTNLGLIEQLVWPFQGKQVKK